MLNISARKIFLGALVVILAVLGAQILHAKSPLPPIKLTVDASEAPRKILHARLVMPVTPGPLTLFYPQWIPGEHGPTGPIVELAGLKLTAGGKPIPWRRDLVDMYAIHCEVPEGVNALEIELDYLAPTNERGYSSAASTTAELAVINWNQVLLYPRGWTPEELTYTTSLRLPDGWKFGTGLPVAKQSGATVEFAPVSLTTLIDSPVIAGAYFRAVPLPAGPGPSHEIDIVADSAAALEMSPELRAHYEQLVAESGALFGARHYREYHFLLTLSDDVAHYGLEHHESSDNRVWERTLLEEAKRKVAAGLLPHEFVHSWNGKYRRPADLTTPDYQQPMKTDLLWVYEGLTQYLGFVLAARSGLWSPQDAQEHLALVAAGLEHHPGRTWRPLEDTADAAQILYGAPREWVSWRRSTDYYDEGLLIWLEADVIIRQQTQGRRSMDDFCRRFHGGQSGPPAVKTYTFDDVVAALQDVAPYDWRTFLTTRLTSTSPHAPLGGIEGGGWRLISTDAMPGFLKAVERAQEITDVSHSIGLTLVHKQSEGERRENGKIIDVIPGTAAARAGIGPGMKLVAVNGRHWSPEVLREALRAAKNGSGTVDLLIENGEFYKTFSLDYHDGERYPHLERDTSRPDLLDEILKPLASASAGKP